MDRQINKHRKMNKPFQDIILMHMHTSICGSANLWITNSNEPFNCSAVSKNLWLKAMILRTFDNTKIQKMKSGLDSRWKLERASIRTVKREEQPSGNAILWQRQLYLIVRISREQREILRMIELSTLVFAVHYGQYPVISENKQQEDWFAN